MSDSLNLSDDSILVEKLADYAHEAWSGWMKYLFSNSTLNDDSSVTIPPDLARRWSRQVCTKYENLPENEKESDRAEARKMLAIINGTEIPDER